MEQSKRLDTDNGWSSEGLGWLVRDRKEFTELDYSQQRPTQSQRADMNRRLEEFHAPFLEELERLCQEFGVEMTDPLPLFGTAHVRGEKDACLRLKEELEKRQLAWMVRDPGLKRSGSGRIVTG